MPSLPHLLAARGTRAGALEEAQARQAQLGGALDTSLLELRVLQLGELDALWSELSGLPRPGPDVLAAVGPSMANLFPQQLAERYGMVPLGLVRRQLSLLVKYPVDLATVDEISFLLSRPVRLFVGSELEITDLLGKVYGTPVPVRFKALRVALGAGSSAPANPRPRSDAREVSRSDPGSFTEEDTPPQRRVPSPPSPRSLPSVIVRLSEGDSIAPDRRETEETEPGRRFESEQQARHTGRARSSPSMGEDLGEAPTPAPPSRKISAPVVRAVPQTWADQVAPMVDEAVLPIESPVSSAPNAPGLAILRSPALETPSEITMPGRPSPNRSPSQSPPWVVPEKARITPSSFLESSWENPGERPGTLAALRTSTWWDEAGARLSIEAKDATVLKNAPASVARVVEPAPSPFEASPLVSGYAGRSAEDRWLSAAQALAALRDQPTRDGVIGVVIDFLRGAFDFVAILVRHGEAFQIFEASGLDYGGGADLSQTSVSLERSRVLRTVAEGRAPYIGTVPPGDPLEGALGAVGRSKLRAVLLYPIVIRDRTVAVVHGDRGGEALAPRQLADVALVLSQVGAQLERVIRERRTLREEPTAPGRRVYPERSAPVGAPPGEPFHPLVAASAPALAPAEAAPLETPKTALPEDVPSPPASAPVAAPPETDSGDLGGASSEAALTAGTGAPEPFEVPVEWTEIEVDSGFAGQVRAFLSGDPPARRKATEALRGGGAEAAWALAERFPGPLYVFRMSIDELPAPAAMGPLVGLIASLGKDAVPAMIDLSSSPGEERRFWATVLLAKVGARESIPALAHRLLDPAPDVALAARRGLWRMRESPEFADVLTQLEAQLGGSDLERLPLVIRALGQFHHLPAVPRLISFVGIRDPVLSQAAADALREITRQDFQQNERRWNAWWDDSKSKPRLLWLIEALEHRDRDLRLAAISELTEIAGFDLGYRSDVDPRKQTAAVDQWREWWEREGRGRIMTPSPR